jgi:hypothetical protein
MARRNKRSIGKSYANQSLNGADFSNEVLQHSDFSGSSLTGCDFSSADLEHSSFANAALTGVDFSSSSLEESDFRGASLSGCDFSSANLENADFTNAKISGCDFNNADTDGCKGLERTVGAVRQAKNTREGIIQQSGHVVNIGTGGSSGRPGRAVISSSSFGAVFGNVFSAIGRVNNVVDLTIGQSIVEFGWLRFESNGDVPSESPSVSSWGAHHGEIDARVVDFGFEEWLIRAESIGGGRIRLSARNSESAQSGEFWEVTLERGESVKVLGGTVYNQLD